MTKLKPYEESGKFSIISPVVLLLFGVIGSVILGFIYSYAIHYIPFIYLNVVIALGFGGLMGIVTGYAGKITHVRNKKLLAVMGLINGCIALYFSWIVWLRIIFEGYWFVSPSEFWEAIQLVNEYGTWGLGRSSDTAISGVFLTIIWVIEGGIVVLLSAIASTISGVYCEDCGKWIDDETTKTFEVDAFSPQNSDDLESESQQNAMDISTRVEAIKEAVECGDFSLLNKLSKATDASPANTFLVVKYAKCKECNRVAYLSLEKKEITLDKKGKKDTNKTTLLDNLMISSDMYTELEML